MQRALVRVPIQHSGTMTSARSDDCRSLRPGPIATAAVESPRRQHPSPAREDVFVAVMGNAPLEPARTARFDGCDGKRTRYEPAFIRSQESIWSGPFHAPGWYGREWQPGLREEHGDD